MNAKSKLRVAVPKGAIFEDALRALGRAGLAVKVLRDDGRRLFYEAEDAQFIVCRPSDVPVYVEYGAADVGIAGKDVLEEGEPNVVELKDLGTGGCRMILAAPAGKAEEVREAIGHAEVVRVATKYPHTARRYFEGIGRQAEIITLKGSIELARENNLLVLDEISSSTARLIANRGSYRLRNLEISALAEAMGRDEIRLG